MTTAIPTVCLPKLKGLDVRLDQWAPIDPGPGPPFPGHCQPGPLMQTAIASQAPPFNAERALEQASWAAFGPFIWRPDEPIAAATQLAAVLRV